jgi:predicted DsbA family dithiol-disulfide isomerase
LADYIRSDTVIVKPIQIDAYIDTTCPYCYIGKRQLENALHKRPELQVTINWRALQLNPDAPAEGRDYHQRMSEIIGSEAGKNTAFAKLTDYGQRVGLDLHFDKIGRMPNTLKSLCLIAWSNPGEQQDAIVEALYKACFCDGKYLGDEQLLNDIAEQFGVVNFLQRINDQAELDGVRQQISAAQQLGLGGVPAFVFNQQYLISGAQEENRFLQLIDQLANT